MKLVKDLTSKDVENIFYELPVKDFKYKIEDETQWTRPKSGWNQSTWHTRTTVFSCKENKEKVYYKFTTGRGDPIYDNNYSDFPSGIKLIKVEKIK
jgi:hypothetical protein